MFGFFKFKITDEYRKILDALDNIGASGRAVLVYRELERMSGKEPALGAVMGRLNRLESHGYLTGYQSEGKGAKVYSLTPKAVEILRPSNKVSG